MEKRTLVERQIMNLIYDETKKAIYVVNPPGYSVSTAGDEYQTNDIAEPSAVLTYFGKEKADGTWLVMSVDTTSGTAIRYASVANNAAITTYAAAWAARATLTYNTYAVAL
jgi:hypothetical protein